MLIFARLKAQIIDFIEYVAHHIAARQLALNTAEDFTDFVLNRIGRSLR